MGISAFLMRLGFYSSLVSIPLYFYAQGEGVKQGQIEGYRQGYSQCEVVKNKEIVNLADKSYNFLKENYSKMKLVCDGSEQQLEELLKAKEKAMQTTQFSEKQIEESIESMVESKAEKGE